MPKSNLSKRLNSVSEITLSVKGRKSGKDIARPVWFVLEGDTVYLLPVQGSDTNWYKNFEADSMLKVSIDEEEEIIKGTPITNNSKVANVVEKFKTKYGEGDVKKYYPKTDVAVEVPL